MSSWFQRCAPLAVLGVACCLGADAQAQTAAAPNAAHPSAGIASSPQRAASAPAEKKKKHASRAKTPPGKPPRGAAQCNEKDKAHQERCLRDLYGPGAPPA